MHTKTNIEILSVRKVITSGVNLMRSLNDIDNFFKSSYEKTHENSILIIIAYDRIRLLTTFYVEYLQNNYISLAVLRIILSVE